MLNSSEYNRIIEKLKKSLDIALDKYYKELDIIEQKYRIQQELKEIENLETLTCLETNEIIQYMLLVDPTYRLEQSELEKNIIFYSIGVKNQRFKSSPRYIEAEEKLQIIKRKFDEYVNKINIVDKEYELLLRTNIKNLENLIETIGPDNTIIGELNELYTYLPIFDEKWTEEEKIALFSILVKAHIENLINSAKQHLEEVVETQETIVEEKANFVKTEIEKKFAEKEFNETIQTTKTQEEQPEESLYSVELSKETMNKIEELKQMIKNSLKELLGKTDVNIKKTTFHNLKTAWDSDNMTFEQIFSTLKFEDLKLFLAYCISTEISDIESLISNKCQKDEVISTKELIAETLKMCSNYAKKFTEIEQLLKETAPTEETPIIEATTMKLIFYTQKGGESEFEKTLKTINKERLEGLEHLISKLENGNIKTATILAKGNDSKLKYIANRNVFITFKVLPNKHILVFHIADIDTINRKTTDNRLNTYSFKVEKKLSEIILDGTRFPEGTSEYRQLISENKTILESIKEKFSGMKRGDTRA